mmetsp:Transcript_12961/g.39132  ORF Transcript_12961/g.39132 Transcript_12961/m.39132 type:complete len:231 (-) Transcript_12961:180-872(-)
MRQPGLSALVRQELLAHQESSFVRRTRAPRRQPRLRLQRRRPSRVLNASHLLRRRASGRAPGRTAAGTRRRRPGRREVRRNHPTPGRVRPLARRPVRDDERPHAGAVSARETRHQAQNEIHQGLHRLVPRLPGPRRRRHPGQDQAQEKRERRRRGRGRRRAGRRRRRNPQTVRRQKKGRGIQARRPQTQRQKGRRRQHKKTRRQGHRPHLEVLLEKKTPATTRSSTRLRE